MSHINQNSKVISKIRQISYQPFELSKKYDDKKFRP